MAELRMINPSSVEVDLLRKFPCEPDVSHQALVFFCASALAIWNGFLALSLLQLVQCMRCGEMSVLGNVVAAMGRCSDGSLQQCALGPGCFSWFCGAGAAALHWDAAVSASSAVLEHSAALAVGFDPELVLDPVFFRLYSAKNC